MTRAVITLRSSALREQASHWIAKAPEGTRVEFRAPQRSPQQNDLMWARLTDVARQTDWHGEKLTASDWKDMFTASLRRARIVPNIDGDGFVQLGLHTSEMSKDEMGNLLDLIDAFAAERGITFHDSPERPDDPQVEGQADRPTEEPTPIRSSVGQQLQTSAPPCPGADEGEGDGGDHQPSPGLPEGWEITYSAALRRAQKPASLAKLASQYWEQYGGWDQHKHGSNAATAAAIFNAFKNHIGNKDAIEAELREIF